MWGERAVGRLAVPWVQHSSQSSWQESTHLSPPLASSCWLRFWLIMVASKLSCCTPLMLSLSSGTYTQWSGTNTTTGTGCCVFVNKVVSSTKEGTRAQRQRMQRHSTFRPPLSKCCC